MDQIRRIVVWALRRALAMVERMTHTRIALSLCMSRQPAVDTGDVNVSGMGHPGIHGCADVLTFGKQHCATIVSPLRCSFSPRRVSPLDRFSVAVPMHARAYYYLRMRIY